MAAERMAWPVASVSVALKDEAWRHPALDGQFVPDFERCHGDQGDGRDDDYGLE